MKVVLLYCTFEKAYCFFTVKYILVIVFVQQRLLIKDL